MFEILYEAYKHRETEYQKGRFQGALNMYLSANDYSRTYVLATLYERLKKEQS